MRSIPPFIAIVDSVYAMLVLGLNCNGLLHTLEVTLIWTPEVVELVYSGLRCAFIALHNEWGLLSNKRVWESSTSEDKLFIYVIIVESVH